MSRAKEDAAAKPEPLERGRYAVYDRGGDMLLARSTGLCDTCLNCGCGTPADPVELPPLMKGQAAVMSWVMRNANGGMMTRLAGLMRRG